MEFPRSNTSLLPSGAFRASIRFGNELEMNAHFFSHKMGKRSVSAAIAVALDILCLRLADCLQTLWVAIQFRGMTDFCRWPSRIGSSRNFLRLLYRMFCTETR